MWTKLKSSLIVKKDEKELIKDGREKLNVNEEYVSALRTKSYVDFFAKAQSLVNKSPFSSFFHHKFSEILLEPCQESIPEILESVIFSKISDLKTLMLTYFELSAEASRICSHLLKNINQIQLNHQFIRQVFNNTITIDQDYLSETVNSFISHNNPFSTPSRNEFKMISDKYSSVLHHLKSKRRRVARKLKLITCINRASGVCVTAACGLVAISAIVIAAHTLTALIMGPAILSLPLKGIKKKILGLKFLKNRTILKKIGRQLDVAAKGIYILNRDFDTMSRLVSRVYDEIEHNKKMVKFCLEKREDDKFSMEMIKELKKSEIGFKKQIEELEEHVYLCLLTINRARSLVVNEMIN